MEFSDLMLDACIQVVSYPTLPSSLGNFRSIARKDRPAVSVLRPATTNKSKPYLLPITLLTLTSPPPQRMPLQQQHLIRHMPLTSRP